jgi:hypothetical protein
MQVLIMKRSALLFIVVLHSVASGADVGNRLAYLNDFANPYYVSMETARLATPQWVGESGVEAVIVLAIDDLGEPAKYESYLRPILERLKRIDGRAPVSLMTKSAQADSTQIQEWLKEGLTVETHTADHPCPCLQGGQFDNAKRTFDQSIDNINLLPNHRPVAFRMPCCDSMNSVSPRFFAEIWSRRTPAGNFLTIDSSVFLLFTARDPQLPEQLVIDEEGNERFRKYIPTDRMMVNYVEDYCYPFIIDRLCWEFPALMPSDWDAQHLNGKCAPKTVRDLKAAVDAVVLKQGVFSLCFHPHGWIDNRQVVELIDHAVSRYGSRVKFLTFGEVNERLQKNLLAGQSLRTEHGTDNGVRLCDVNYDGYMDVIIGNADRKVTRIWNSADNQWLEIGFPVALSPATVPGRPLVADVQFGVLNGNGLPSILVDREDARGLWHFASGTWLEDSDGLSGLTHNGLVRTLRGNVDTGVRLRDLDGDGVCELVLSNPQQQAVFSWTGKLWRIADFALPQGLTIVDQHGRDAGLRFVDLNEDGYDDVVFSNASRFASYLFDPMDRGWTGKLMDRPRRGVEGELPMIVRGDGTNNGVWFKSGQMWVQNEDTGKALPHHVDYRPFSQFLASED